MKNLIRKINLEQTKYYYYFIWGYYYGAGCFTCNKIKSILSNELNKGLCILITG